MDKSDTVSRHIVLTSHPRGDREGAFPIRWGAADPGERGPVVGTFTNPGERNVIGAHAGAYALYRALAIASGSLDPEHRPDLTNTAFSAKVSGGTVTYSVTTCNQGSAAAGAFTVDLYYDRSSAPRTGC